MSEPKNPTPRVPSEAVLRRIAADREARIRLDEMYRRDEIEEARARAYAEGFVRGLAEARAKAEARMRAEFESKLRDAMLRALEVHFGSLDPARIAAVRSASAEQIERWVERLDQATSPDDVLVD